MTGTSGWLLSGFGDEIDADPRVQCAVLAASGAAHLEVRSAWGVGVLDLDERRLEELRIILREFDFGVSAVASPIGKSDADTAPEYELDRLHRAIRVAAVLATLYVRTFSFYPGAFPDAAAARDAVLRHLAGLAAAAEAADVILLHENEKGVYGDVPARVLDLVECVGSPALRLAWDSANSVQVGVRPFTDGYAALRPHLEYVQVKDAVAATGAVVPAGDGDGAVAETLAALRDDGYTGFFSLEPHLPAPPGRPGFAGAAAFGTAARALLHLTRTTGMELS